MKKSPLKKKTPLKNRGTKIKKNSKLKRSAITKRKRNIAKNVSRKKSRKSSPLWVEIVKCDLAFSQYIRLTYANEKGIVKCYTCEMKAFWKQSGIECGHFKGRTNMNTRWLKSNCKPQCTQCNQYLQGNLKIFEKNLIAEYGEDIIPFLNKEASKKEQLIVSKVKNLRNYFESEVVKLKQRLEI